MNANKKGFVLPTIVIIAVALIAFIGIMYFTGQHIDTASLIADITTGCSAKTGKLVLPVFGYFECKELGETSIDYQIPALGLTEQVNANTGSGYYKVYCDEFVESCNFYTVSGSPSQVTNLAGCANVPMGSYCAVKKNLAIPFLSDGTQTVRKTFKPFSLWLESRLGQSGWVDKTKWSCSLFDYGLQAKAYCTASTVTSALGSTNGQCDGDKLYKTAYLDFNQNSNFVEGWVDAPYDLNVVDRLGTKVYCGGQGYIYSLGTLQTTAGCYNYPASSIAKEDCCPNQVLGNAVCGSNFKWSTSAPATCWSDMNCPTQGLWVTDYNDGTRTTLTQSKCINGACVSNTKKVQCSTNEGCPTGEMCMVDAYNGGGSCVAGGTNVQTTPRTPTIIKPNVSLTDWLISLVTAFIIAFILLGAIWVLALVFTPLKMLPFFKFLFNPKIFAIAVIVLGLAIFFLWTGSVLMVKATIFG